MHSNTIRTSGLIVCLAIANIAPTAFSQAKRPSLRNPNIEAPPDPKTGTPTIRKIEMPPIPKIDVQNYKIEVNLTPDLHEVKAAATITFNPLEPANSVVFELSENLSVRKVMNSEGAELDFGQDEIKPGILSVRFTKPLSSGTNETIRIEYEGGFDRDRFSRVYTRDEGSAYIGMEGTYLMYSAKWIPINQFLVDRATETLEVTVPLGMTVIGSGTQLPVAAKGINQTFGWTSNKPILPGSFVAGLYFQKKVQIGNLAIECFSREDKQDPMLRNAEAAAKIIEYYQTAYGLSSSGNNFRLVEVDEQLARQPGMLGTIFITHSELAQSKPPIRQLARRIAFQWWQETVGILSAGDLWLEDGMAYFSAAQYIGKADGKAAYKEEINNLAVLALKFEKNSAISGALELGHRTDKYESVVAGKGAWIANMLQGIMGESEFKRLVQQYINDYAGSAGSTAAFQKLAEKICGKELEWFFTEWLDAVGVPTFQLEYVILKTSNGFKVSGTLKQDRDSFRMPIEIEVAGNGREEIKTVESIGKSTSYDISTFSKPEKIILDPNNKLLRNSKELQISVQISLANDLKKGGEFVDAIYAYEKALQLSPHSSLIHFRLAEVFFEQFNMQSAANSFRDALNGDKDPKWIEVWCYIYIGKIYDILGQRQRAMAEYAKAINTKDDTNGAQAEADKWLKAPFTKSPSAN
jgi:tetratricopeptide (TPR) repeat protein